MRRTIVMVAAPLAALLVAGCGGSNGPNSAAATSGTTSGAATASATATTGGTSTKARTAASGVPDACTLITPADLTAILGTEHGTGEPHSVSPARSVCMYPNGTITAVEIAGDYEASRRIIEENGSKTQDVAGVGKAAFYDPNGQLIAKGDKVFVAVTVFGVDIDKMKAAAAKMLDAAE